MNQVLVDFRKDLKNGLTIDDACRKHGVTFKYVMDNMERPYTKNRKPNRRSKCTSTKISLNIYRIGKGGFTIYKSVNSRSQNFGTYRTVEDAIKVRDYFYEHGWDRKELDKVCQDLNIMRR